MILPGFWEGVLVGGGVALLFTATLWWWVRHQEPRVSTKLSPGEAGSSRPTQAPTPPSEVASETFDVQRKAGEPAVASMASEVTPRGAGPPPPSFPKAPSEEGLRISYRILLHIASQGRFGPHELPPESLTQAGMSERLEVGRGALSNALRRLGDARILEVQTSHVRGRPKRLKIYRLTPEGEVLVKELRSRFRR